MKSSMRMALAALITVLVLGLAVVLFAPRTAVIERSVLIDAPPDVVYAQVVDMERYQTWSPWAAADPTMEVEYGEKKTGVGASYSWSGEDSGTGSLTVKEATPPTRLVNVLDFGEMGGGTATWTFADESGKTRTTWSVRTENPGTLGAVFALMADPLIGPSFEDGLSRLKDVAEKEAK